MDNIFEKYGEAFWSVTDKKTAILTVTNAVLKRNPEVIYSTVALVFDLSLPGFYLSAWENELDLDPHYQIPLKVELGELGCSVNS